MSGTGKSIETGGGSVFARCWTGGWEVIANEGGVFFWGSEKILELYLAAIKALEEFP